jgi:hypothetical protein
MLKIYKKIKESLDSEEYDKFVSKKWVRDNLIGDELSSSKKVDKVKNEIPILI